MEDHKIKSLFHSFASKKILIIGDVMVDAYMWGKVERISPEAPIPVVSVTTNEYRLGGAANVALNIKALGATPILCSVIGKDAYENVFYTLLDAENLSSVGILSSENRKTTVKTRVISDGQHLLRVDEENTSNLDAEIERNLCDKVSAIIETEKIDAIIFEDYDKGVITLELIKKIVEIASENNIPVTVDPKKRNFNNYHNISLFKPNFKELTEGLKLDIGRNDFNGIFQACKRLQVDNNIKYVMITLSDYGIIICNSETYFHIPAEIRSIADVSGAGDTVISVATLGLLADLSVQEMASVSNLAGGLVCEKVGVTTLDLEQFFEELKKWSK